MGELCDRIDAFGSELPPAIALQLCALAAVVGLRGFIARESTGTDFSLGRAKIISSVGSCYRDMISTENASVTENTDWNRENGRVWFTPLSFFKKKTNVCMKY